MTTTSTNLFVRDRFTWLAYFMLAYYAYLPATLGPLMPFLRTELNLSYTTAGLHLSAYAFGMILAGLTGDHLAQKWGRRLVFWTGGVGLTLGALGLALSSQVILTITSALMMGWVGTFLLVIIQATLSDRHGERRAIALTESNIAASISASLAPVLVGGFQRAGIGWRGALFLGAAVFALIFVQYQSESLPPSRQSAAETRATGRSLPYAFWAYWVVVVLVVSIEWCMTFWGADFLEKVVGLSKVDAATMLSVFFVAMVLGRITGSRLTRILPGTTVLLLALGTAIIGFPLFWLARFAPLNIAGLFITGLGVASLYPLTLSVAAGVAPQQANVASARISLAAGLAIFSAPLVLGWTADQFNIQNAYGIVAILLMTALAVTLFMNQTTSPAAT